MNIATDTFDADQRAVLESIAKGTKLERVLEDIVLLIEGQSAGMLCSILLLEDGRYLRHGAAPHLPSSYARAIDGTAIGPNEGSCGAAAYSRSRVIVERIDSHPNWTAWRDLASSAGLRACWSTPIMSGGDVLGTFAMYYQEPRGPTPAELEWVDVATHLASIAILRDRTEQDLRRSEARAHQLARLHAVGTSINKRIARERDPQKVYELACQIVVEEGLAPYAWLGLLSADGWQVERVAQAGGVPSSERLLLDFRNPRFHGGPAYRAVTSGEPVVTYDLQREVPAHWLDRLQRHGLRSSATLPLMEGERMFGLFTLYATEPGYFEDEKLQVLTALAADISYGVEFARQESERQRMEDAVRASERLRAVIYSAVSDGIFYLQCEQDDRYRVISVNRAVMDLFGLRESDVVGRLVNEVMPEDEYARVLERYRQARRTRARVSWEQLIEPATGTRHVEVTIAPIFAPDGRCTNLVGMVHDITARIQAEAERARLVAQLNHSQRMQALGTLAGGIAHDFNNILAAISGNAGLALQEPLEAAVRTPLLEIQKASRRAIDLVRQILTFSRSAPPKFEAVQAVDVAREALALLRATLPQTVVIQSEFSSQALVFEGDSTQFHQVVMNLATNAAHSLPPRGGSLLVQLDDVTVTEDAPPVAGLSAGRYVRLQVVDSGCGMDESTLKRAFDPFFTTRAPGEGTGLGLSVVHGIVQAHQGVVDIRSALGRGTAVTVYFPAAQNRTPSAAAPQNVQGSGERVLYVDDEEALVFLMGRALSKMGYAVSGYCDPAAALSAFRNAPYDFDVVVTDVSMPGMSGPDLAEQVLRIRADIPVIMTSGYLREGDLQAAKRLGIKQVIYKANTIEELGSALQREIQAHARCGVASPTAQTVIV